MESQEASSATNIAEDDALWFDVGEVPTLYVQALRRSGELGPRHDIPIAVKLPSTLPTTLPPGALL